MLHTWMGLEETTFCVGVGEERGGSCIGCTTEISKESEYHESLKLAFQISISFGAHPASPPESEMKKV